MNMAKTDKSIIKEFNATRRSKKFLCNAPFCAMRFSISGLVSPCCHSFGLNDCYPNRNIRQIWNGSIFKEYRQSIRKGQLPNSCTYCESRLKSKEFSLIPIRQFDDFKVRRIGHNNLQTLQLAISNRCNLKCPMCNEMFSSQYDQSDTFDSDNIYNEAFINELNEYIPHLNELICLGGEPFLINEYYDIWDKIISVNPSCRISVVTNGTILNDRIKRLLELGNFSINLSFETIVKETYEKIRVNANYDTVISNMEYFAKVLRQQGKTLQIPACALKSNSKELPDLVRFCNENEYHLTILTTYRDIDVAMWSLPSDQLKELKDYYLQQTFTTHDWNSNDNVSNFKNFISTVDRWISDAEKKENFQNIFDLKTDKVTDLKNRLFSNMEKCLKETSLSEDDFGKKREYILGKWNRIMNSLPEYFESNHLYKILLQVSPYIIVEYMLRCNSQTMAKTLEEGFYYGFTH